VSDVKSEVLELFSQPLPTALATITAEGRPWARYVIPRLDEDLTFWVATGSGSRKVAQIKKNPEVHLCGGVTSFKSAQSWAQVQGRAEILDDAETKKARWRDELRAYFTGPEDPNYCLIKITPQRIEYYSMNSMEPRVWEV
jgi:general stress protein 26